MSDIVDDKNIQKLLKIRLFYFSFTIPSKVVFKDSVYLLGTTNSRNNTLLVRTILYSCKIPCQRLLVPNSVFIGVILGRRLEENSFSESL